MTTPLCEAVSAAAMPAATGAVVTGNAFVSVPAGTVIVAGTFATAGLVLVSAIVMPPTGASAVQVDSPGC